MLLEGASQPTNRYQYTYAKFGIGIVSYTNFKFTPFNPEETYNGLDMGLCGIVDAKVPFQIVGVWTGPKNKRLPYVNSVNTFLHDYHDWILGKDTIILGDFNSNLNYDFKTKAPHQRMLNQMSELDMVSVYHEYFREKQGEETRYTYYQHRKTKSMYHIDYIFIPKKMLGRVNNVYVGDYKEWSQFSDHMPIIIDIEYPYGSLER